MSSIFAEIQDFAFMPEDTPACTYKASLADQVAAGSVIDTGVTSPEGSDTMLHHIRVRLVIKSGMTNGNTFAMRVKVDDDTNFASPEVVAQTPAYTFVTGDAYITMTLYGYSHTGFTAYKLFGTNSGGAAVYDAQVDCW